MLRDQNQRLWHSPQLVGTQQSKANCAMCFPGCIHFHTYIQIQIQIKVLFSFIFCEFGELCFALSRHSCIIWSRVTWSS